MKKVYKIKTRLYIDGVFEVKADNKTEAKKFIEENVGLCLGGNIHTSCNDEDIDWNFPIHFEKKF